MTVLICDDIADRGEDAATRLHTAGQSGARTLVGEQLSMALKSLFGRVRACQDEPASYKHEESLFDHADVLLLDNNLTHLEAADRPPLTAESIAGYLRAFTTAGYIVSLNMNPDVDFDLSFRGIRESSG
jgi:hypothetical protein